MLAWSRARRWALTRRRWKRMPRCAASCGATPVRAISPFLTDGYGLGLSIAKRIVEAHGGTIGAEINPTRGASFIVTSPRVASPPSGAGRPLARRASACDSRAQASRSLDDATQHASQSECDQRCDSVARSRHSIRLSRSAAWPDRAPSVSGSSVRKAATSIETYLRKRRTRLTRSHLVESRHRVHSRRPARRQVRRDECDEEQHAGRQRQRERILRGNTVQPIRDQS
jgi:hypothetical protein